MPDPLDAMFQQWGGGYEGTGTPETQILNNIAEETPEERARRLQITAGQKGPMQGPGIGSERNLGAPDNPIGQFIENAAVGIQDFIDNTFQGNQATPDQIRASRRGQAMEGRQKIQEGRDKALASDPILNSEPARVVGGGIKQAAENVANFADLANDTLTRNSKQAYSEMFPSLFSPLNPKDDVFSNKYEAASYDFGSSQMAQTPIGKVAQGLLGFGITLWATGGFRGDSGIIGATRAIRSGQGATGAARAFGTSGAVRGAFADLIDNPENGNLSNLIKDNAPEWYPTWLTALAVEKGENPWVSRLKTAFEGMGLSEVGDLLVGVVAGRRAGVAARKSGASLEQAADVAAQTARDVADQTPRATKWVDVASTPQNAPYFTLGPRNVDTLNPAVVPFEQLYRGEIPGFTVNPLTGESPVSGFLVSIDAGKVLDEVSPQNLDEFIFDNAEALSRDDAFVGGWLDPVSGKPVVEVSRLVQDSNEALRLAKEFDQTAVYDVANQSFIKVGGSDQLKRTRNSGFNDVNYSAGQQRVASNARLGDFLGRDLDPKVDGTLLYDVSKGLVPPDQASNVIRTLQNLSPEDQIKFYRNTEIGIRDDIRSYLSINAQLDTFGGQAVRKTFLPNSSQVLWRFSDNTDLKNALELDPGNKVITIDWEMVDGSMRIDRYGRRVISDFNKMAENEIPAGTIVANVPADDYWLGGRTSEAQARRSLTSIQQNKLEALQQYLDEAKRRWLAENASEANNEIVINAGGLESYWEKSISAEGKMEIADRLARTDPDMPDYEQILSKLSGSPSENSIRARLYSRAGFGEVDPGSEFQYAIVRSMPDANGRWLEPFTPVWTGDDFFNGKLANKAELDEAILRNTTNQYQAPPTPNISFGDIQRIAAQQTVANSAGPFAPRGGSDGILTDAAHRLIGASPGGDELLTDIAKSDPDLQAIASETGRSVEEIRQEAAQLVADFNGDVEALPSFRDMSGRQILSDSAVVAVKSLIQDTANQLSESAYAVLKVGNANMDMLPQVERMADQLKTLLRAHKFTSQHFGRGLATFKIPALGIEVPNYFKKPSVEEIAKSVKDTDAFLDKLVKDLGSGDPKAMEEATRLANALMLAGGDPARIRKFGQWAAEIAGRDGLSIMYNSMLSGPPTHIVNTVSNLFNAVYRPASAYLGSFFSESGYIERKAAAASFSSFYDTVRESWDVASRVIGNGGFAINDGSKDFIRAAEVGAQLDLMRKAAEQSNDESFKFGVGMLETFHNLAANPVLNYASGFLTTTDEFFKTMVARMEWKSRSMREAIDASSRSLKSVDEEFKNILKANADKWFITEGAQKGAIKDDKLLSSAKDVTFQTDLEGMARAFGTMVEAIPPMRIFFPFVKTGHNVLAYAYSHLPVIGTWLPEYQKAMSSGDPYLMSIMKGRQAFGTFVIGTAGIAAMSGNLTGNGPADPEERKLWMINNKPRSVRIPGTDMWFDYSRIEPFNMILSAVADTAYYFQSGKMRERDAEYLMGYAMYAISANLTQRSYFAGLVPLGQILTPGGQGMSKLASIPLETINNFIPLSGARRTLSNMLTPYMREFDGELNRILYSASGTMIKGASAPRYSWLTGEPMASPSAGGNAVWPFRIQQRKADPVVDELEDIGYEPSNTIRSAGVELTPTMLSAVQKAMGESDLKKKLSSLFQSKAYQTAKQEAEQEIANGSRATKRNFWFYRQIDNLVNEARDNAITQLYGTNDGFRREADSTKNDKIRARMAPPASPPDTSFLDALITMPN